MRLDKQDYCRVCEPLDEMEQVLNILSDSDPSSNIYGASRVEVILELLDEVSDKLKQLHSKVLAGESLWPEMVTYVD